MRTDASMPGICYVAFLSLVLKSLWNAMIGTRSLNVAVASLRSLCMHISPEQPFIIIVAGSSVAVAVAFRNNANHDWVVVKFILNHQEQPCKTIQYMLQTRIKHNTFNKIKTIILTIQYIQVLKVYAV